MANSLLREPLKPEHVKVRLYVPTDIVETTVVEKQAAVSG